MILFHSKSEKNDGKLKAQLISLGWTIYGAEISPSLNSSKYKLHKARYSKDQILPMVETKIQSVQDFFQ